MKKILFLLLALPVAYALINPTFSYFSDTEVSTGNTFRTGTWETQAGYLNIDTGAAKLTGNGGKLHSILIDLNTTHSITIDKMIVNWTVNNAEKIEEIRIGGATFWAGSELSDALLDGEYILTKEEQIQFRFDSDMQGKSFTVTFIMGDSSKKIIIINP
jgi:predicted ribosomally synthesized peptide with SipW-like signal peptide